MESRGFERSYWNYGRPSGTSSASNPGLGVGWHVDARAMRVATRGLALPRHATPCRVRQPGWEYTPVRGSVNPDARRLRLPAPS